MKKDPQKIVLVDQSLHHKLLMLKAEKNFKSLSDTIEFYVCNIKEK
jgi:hypothetical protein